MQRKASARWQGTAKEGAGTIATQSGTLKDTPFSFVARFGDGKGTNPEELIAAAHAGCFTMALSFMLNNAGFTADAIDTEAALTLLKTGDRAPAKVLTPPELAAWTSVARVVLNLHETITRE